MRRVLGWLTVTAIGAAGAAGADARASALRGTVAVEAPAAARDQKHAPLGYFRFENGRLPIARAPADHRASAVVVATPAAGGRTVTPAPNAVRLEARALSLSPPITIAPVGSRVELRNLDRVPRTLYLLDGEGYMPRQAIAPGGTREVKLTVAGAYEIRDADFAHAHATVLIVDTPYVARADERGDWKLELPDGRYAVKAFARGAWSAPSTVEVGAPPPPAREHGHDHGHGHGHEHDQAPPVPSTPHVTLRVELGP